MQPRNACIEIFIHLYPIAVKFQFGRIEQSFDRGKARHYMVNRLNKVDNIHHGTVGHGGGNISRYGVRKRGLQIGLSKLLRPGAFSVENIPEALYENMPRAEHIGQLPDLLRVFDRLIKGGVEVMGAENGYIGII